MPHTKARVQQLHEKLGNTDVSFEAIIEGYLGGQHIEMGPTVYNSVIALGFTIQVNKVVLPGSSGFVTEESSGSVTEESLKKLGIQKELNVNQDGTKFVILSPCVRS